MPGHRNLSGESNLGETTDLFIDWAIKNCNSDEHVLALLGKFVLANTTMEHHYSDWMIELCIDLERGGCLKLTLSEVVEKVDWYNKNK